MTISQPTRIDAAMDQRRKQLRLRWRDVADRAGVSEETIRLIRKGARDESVRETDTEAKVARALGWAPGGIQALREGRQPTLLLDAETQTPSSRFREDPPSWIVDDPALMWIWDGYAREGLLTKDEAMAAIIYLDAKRTPPTTSQRQPTGHRRPGHQTHDQKPQ